MADTEPMRVPLRVIDGGATTDAATLRAALDCAPDCIQIIELDGRLTFMNASGLLAMEIDDASRVIGAPWDGMWPASTRREVLDAVEAAAEGRTSRFEAYCPTARGTPRWWDVSVSPVTGSTGTNTGGVERAVAILRDATGRVHRENQLRLHEIELNQLAVEQADQLRDQQATIDASDALMRAVDHRMKNSLAMLGSLLKMETRRVADEDVRATLKAAAARVATIASVHEQLYRGQEKDALPLDPYLAALVRDLVGSMSSGPGGPALDVVVEADDVVLNGGKALALGLATVELVMNAIRHGTKTGVKSGSDAGPRAIEVECRREGPTMRLSITDDGPGLPADFDPFASRGLGMRVVQSSLAKLEGEMEWLNRPEGGARVTLVWPL